MGYLNTNGIRQTMKIGKMEISKTVAWTSVGLLGVGLGLWYWFQERDEKSNETFKKNNSGRASKPGFCTSNSYPLNYGTCHEDVKKVQTILLENGAFLGTTGSNGDGVDGEFGKITKMFARKMLSKTSFTKEDVKSYNT